MWELVARECIRDTVARYNHAGDSGRYAAMVDCFAADGVLTIVGDGSVSIVEDGEYRGQAALHEFFSGVIGTASAEITHVRHCISNLCIEIESPTTATAKSYFHVITDVGLDHWGRYRDRFVGGNDGWLLEHRSVKTDGYAPNSLFR